MKNIEITLDHIYIDIISGNDKQFNIQKPSLKISSIEDEK